MLSRLVENALRVTLCLLVAAIAPSIQAISAAELIPCGQVSGLKSIDVDGVTAVPLTVRNGSTQTISIDWIESDGAKSTIDKLAPGKMTEVDSSACHAFLLHTSAGKCLCGFVLADRPEEIVSIGANGRCSAQKADTFYEPTASYQQRIVEGWTIFISSAYIGETLLPVLTVLTRKLKQARTSLPPGAIESLQDVRLWLEASDWRHPQTAYHPDARWLSCHRMNPDKAGGIQISAEIVPLSDEQPAMIIHELAHAFEKEQVMREPDRAKLLESAYQAAGLSGRYESVKHRDGSERRAYAMENVQEYFAELSEAYFSENDFYPFNREELKAFDPQGFAAIESLWKVAK